MKLSLQKRFGKKVAGLRRSAGISQEDFADRCGVELGRTVTVSFQDELDFGSRMPMWSPCLPQEFERRTGLRCQVSSEVTEAAFHQDLNTAFFRKASATSSKARRKRRRGLIGSFPPARARRISTAATS